MIYREKKIYSGNILEVEIFPIEIYKRKQSRKKKEKESLPKQKNLNDKNSRKHLSRLLNTNFTDKDFFVTLSYSDNKRPKNEKRVSKDFENFLKRLRRFLKKNNKEELKYINVVEYDENIKIHNHMVMNGIVDISDLERIWGNGNVEVSKLRSNELGYEELAKYLTKDPKGKKRWSQSRNLKKPKVKVNDFKFSKKKVNELANSQGERALFERLYRGYIFREYEVKVNEITSYTHINIKLQKLNN